MNKGSRRRPVYTRQVHRWMEKPRIGERSYGRILFPKRWFCMYCYVCVYLMEGGLGETIHEYIDHSCRHAQTKEKGI